MTPDRKTPTAGFWITVALVAVLVGYPLSVGPVCGAITFLGNPEWAVTPYQTIYAPIFWVYEYGPRPIHDAIDWYCATCGA